MFAWPPVPTCLVVAHPDDEVVGAFTAMKNAPRLSILYLTDGAPRRGGFFERAGCSNWQEYAALRQSESKAAMALLGRSDIAVEYTALPDQQVIEHFREATEVLIAHLLAQPPSILITHAYEGGHPDHDAAAAAACAACSAIKTSHGMEIPIYEMSGYHHGCGHPVIGAFLANEMAGPLIEPTFTDGDLNLKTEMVERFASQRKELADFRRDLERYRRAPLYDFRAPPHLGPLFYDRHGWDIDGQVWRDRLARACEKDAIPI